MSKEVKHVATQTDPISLESLGRNEEFDEASHPSEVTQQEPSEKMVFESRKLPSQHNVYVYQSLAVTTSTKSAPALNSDSLEEPADELNYFPLEPIQEYTSSTGGGERVLGMKPQMPEWMSEHGRVFQENPNAKVDSSIKEDPSLMNGESSKLPDPCSFTEGTGSKNEEPTGIHVSGRDVRPLKNQDSLIPANVEFHGLLDIDSLPKKNTEELQKLLHDTEICGASTSDVDIKTFYSIATHLYRQGKSPSECALCLLMKGERKKGKRIYDEKEKRVKCITTGGEPQSHIFPQCMLEHFKNIHCKTHDDEYIYDQISRNYKSAKTLTFPLFCQTCESNASIEERLLNKVYQKVMGGNEDVSSRKEYFIVKHILAVLLFRGMLVGVDFLKEINCNATFFDIFERLRQFCISPMHHFYSDSADESSLVLPDFHVYLLSNRHYHDTNNPMSKYIVEVKLRNPQFTKMVKASGGDIFLYTKFDCFHCVLPIRKVKIEFPEYEAFHKFPSYLRDHNLQEVGSFIMKHSIQKRLCEIFIEDPLDHSVPILSFSPEIRPPEVEKSSDDHSTIWHARCRSPIALIKFQNPRLTRLLRNLQIAKDQKVEMQSELDIAKGECNELRSQKEKECAVKRGKQEKKLYHDLMISNRQCTELEGQNKTLEEINKELKARNKELEEENAKLKEEVQRRILNPHPVSVKEKPEHYLGHES